MTEEPPNDLGNEIVAAAREASAQRERLRRRWPVAVGIGSAALVAALLYAKRHRKD